MKLYYSDVLSPRKACTVATYLQSPVEYVYLDLARGEHKTPEYLALNPNGKVPTLVDGERSLWEADAIMCELARRADSDLWPKNGERQIDILRWLSWNAQHFWRPCGGLYFEHIIKPRFTIGEADAGAVEAGMKGFRTCAAILDAHLADRTWLVGDQLSVADFSVSAGLAYAPQTQMPLDEFPAMKRWHERLYAIDAWREPFPERTGTAAAV